MKKQTKENIKSSGLGILCLLVIFGVAYLVIDEVRIKLDYCGVESEELVEINCTSDISFGVIATIEHINIDGRCYINCSKQIETLSTLQ